MIKSGNLQGNLQGMTFVIVLVRLRRQRDSISPSQRLKRFHGIYYIYLYPLFLFPVYLLSSLPRCDLNLLKMASTARVREGTLNLKLPEWKAIFPIVDRLSEDGVRSRVLLSGRELPESRLIRARRHLKAAGRNLADGPSQGMLHWPM